jgi:hypothetical protein
MATQIITQSSALSKEQLIELLLSFKKLKVAKKECYELVYIKCFKDLNLKELGKVCRICADANVSLQSISSEMLQRIKDAIESKYPVGLITHYRADKLKYLLNSRKLDDTEIDEDLIIAFKYYNTLYPVVSNEELDILLSKL